MVDHDAPTELRVKAARCRELADQATKPEVAQALRDVANDIDAAYWIIDGSASG